MSKQELARSAFMEGLLISGVVTDEDDMETEWAESDTYALIQGPDAQEAEHLHDMLDCQERVVNLLAPLRELCDSLNVVNPNRRMVRALRAARAAIATEEKETPNG